VNTAKSLIIFSLAAAICLAAPVPQKGIAKTDVYLITIDTLRSDHVHCCGYERVQTPALDALAKDGIRFAQAFTPSPITKSSQNSLRPSAPFHSLGHIHSSARPDLSADRKVLVSALR
jgi:Sulfatase